MKRYAFIVLASFGVLAGLQSQACKSDGTGGDSAGGGGNNSTDTNATVGVSACQSLCDKAGAAMCPNEDLATCVQDCENAMVPSDCVDEYDGLLDCEVNTGTFTCDADGEVVIEGCDAEAEALFGCLMGGGDKGACYEGQGACNPMTDSCAAGEACDLEAAGGFVCFPPPNDVPVGGACDAMAGPFCSQGGTCVTDPATMMAACLAYCCEDVDCGAAETCQVAGMAGATEVKVCAP